MRSATMQKACTVILFRRIELTDSNETHGGFGPVLVLQNTFGAILALIGTEWVELSAAARGSVQAVYDHL